MKIVNLNEYSEGDGMRNKLRQRIDQFEPELSDSLWDRIHHEMGQREANRKKRLLWWFSSVAVVVLTSGIISFILVNKTEPTIALQQPAGTTQTQVPADNAVTGSVENAPAQTGSTGAVTETDAVVSPAPGTTVTTTSNTITNGRNNGRNNTGTTPSATQQTTPSSGNALPAGGNTNADGNDANTIQPGEPAKVTDPAEEVAPPNEAAPALAKDDEAPVAEDEIKNTNNTPTVAQGEDKTKKHDKWFVGLMFGYNQTYRTVSHVDRVLGMPTVDQKNTYEFKGYSPTYGIEFGFLPIKNFYIKSGIGIYNTSETVKYSVYRRTDLGGSQGGPGNPKDSVGAGNNITTQNTYTYIQIPLEVGFTEDISDKLGLFFGGGVAYNILNSYNYNYYESYYGRRMFNATNGNSKYFTNYLQLSASAGAQYTIAKHWRASAGFTYRKAVTSAATKETGVSTKPWSAGAMVGLAFTF